MSRPLRIEYPDAWYHVMNRGRRRDILQRNNQGIGLRGVFNEPRNVAIYLIRVLRCEGLEEIDKDFDMTRYSSVSSVIERVKNQILKDRKFKKRRDAFRAELTKGQTKTPLSQKGLRVQHGGKICNR